MTEIVIVAVRDSIDPGTGVDYEAAFWEAVAEAEAEAEEQEELWTSAMEANVQSSEA